VVIVDKVVVVEVEMVDESGSYCFLDFGLLPIQSWDDSSILNCMCWSLDCGKTAFADYPYN
ncbi:hypothetical protein PIB30_110634, partial [Stylosanthes scabra]|nr:hypothetical protein [Stylosanthes scabra]